MEAHARSALKDSGGDGGSSAAVRPSRLDYADNLRVALISLVIAHHVGQAYGPTGGFWPIMEPARAALLGPFFTVNRSFMMSLFFMIAGYFTVTAFEAKGAAAFLRGRALRLGLPVVAWALLMLPMQLFVFVPKGGHGSAWPLDVGHLWFLQHLLIFSAGYAVWRVVRPSRGPTESARRGPPGLALTLVFALVLAAVTGVVRIWFPIDRWVHIFGFIRVAFADVPRDLGFYIVGLAAGRNDWFSTYPARAGRNWLIAGLGAAGLWYAYDLWLSRVVPIGATTLDVSYLVWEELLCCGMCIGLLVLFRDRFNFTGRLARALGRSQYTAYILHVVVVVAFQAAVIRLAAPPLAKFALVSALSIPATFLISNWLRRPLRL